MKNLTDKLRTRFVPIFALFLAVVAILITIAVRYNLQRDLSDRPSPRLAAPPATENAQIFLGKFQPTVPPKPLPDLSFAIEGGKQFNLRGFLGKIRVINIWATWCPPCVAELPALQRLAERSAHNGVNVILVSVDREGWSKISPFIREHGLDKSTILADPEGKSLPEFGIRGLPTTIIANARGEEIGRIQGDYNWDSPETDHLLSELAAKQ